MDKKGDKDTLYSYHQAMAAPDKIKFQEAMMKEFIDHTDRQMTMTPELNLAMSHHVF
jgi:hypothetical protein